MTGSGRCREVAGPVSGCCLAWRDGRSIAGMSDSIFLLGDDGWLTSARSTAHQAEAELQELLADNVHLLPGAQINRGNPRRWLPIKREAGVPNREGGGGWWPIDLWLLTRTACLPSSRRGRES
jgi:hypothetical protein